METTYLFWISLLVFLPALGALLLALIPKRAEEAIRYTTLVITLVTFVLSVVIYFFPAIGGTFDADQASAAAAKMQYVFNIDWIPSFNIAYYMGTDGISFPLVMLTTFISLLAMGASWSITKYVKGYCILFLLLETGMIGVFMALDFFLFYVFWEVMLLPMYFLIGIWGGPKREYAAIKFFLYTLVGSVLMLIAILLLYFNSDVRALAQKSDLLVKDDAKLIWTDLHINPTQEQEILTSTLLFKPVGEPLDIEFLRDEESPETTALWDAETEKVKVLVSANQDDVQDVVAVLNGNEDIAALGTAEVSTGRGDYAGYQVLRYGDPLHTFNLLALAALGQWTDVFTPTLQWWAFLLLFIGFAIKVPAVPLHTWLPDAHVEAPTPISMILAGVLLKMGGYGIIRICYPICPHGGYELMWFVCIIGVVSMVYGAFAALAQKDFKRLVAYSSVSHMGYVVLGLGVWSAVAGTGYETSYWNLGVQGAMFQMIAHGISSAGMFFMVGIIYDRVHHRNLDEFGGLFGKMPVYTAMAIGLFFAGLGLPGLCGFIGEVFVVLSVWKFSTVLAIISASVVVLTASYILWALQRVYLGAEYKGPHEEAIHPITPREGLIGGVLLALAILLGVFPYQTVLQYMDPTIEQQVEVLAEWTQEVKVPMEQAEAAAAQAEAEADEAPQPLVAKAAGPAAGEAEAVARLAPAAPASEPLQP